MKTIAIIIGAISEIWSLLFKIAIVIVVIVGIWAFINSRIANATLNERSSCQQFQQADTATQNKVLQDMMTAHHDTTGLALTRFSVTFYCNVHDGSSPIDGVYSSGHVDRQLAEAIYRAADGSDVFGPGMG